MKYIASISYGKDSLTMLEIIVKILKLPLDEIVTVDVMFNKDISAYYPEVEAFKKKADELIKARYGIEVKHLRSDITYEDRFYKVRGNKAKEENRGKIYGFPIIRGPWCNSDLKMKPLNDYKKDGKKYCDDESVPISKLDEVIKYYISEAIKEKDSVKGE